VLQNVCTFIYVIRREGQKYFFVHSRELENNVKNVVIFGCTFFKNYDEQL
jgi:hypothetical protein